MRTLLFFIIATMLFAFSLCSASEQSVSITDEKRSCEKFGESFGGERWTRSSNDLERLAREHSARLGGAIDPSFVCIGPGSYFAFSNYFLCEKNGICAYIFIQEELERNLGDALTALIAHEVAHWTSDAGDCKKFDEFVAYTQCEHDVDLLGSEVVGVDLMIQALKTLISFAEERDEPYTNAIWGWQMRIQMLEAIQKLSL